MEKRSDRYKVSKLKVFLIIILMIFILIGSIIVWSRFVSTSGLDVKETKIVNNKLPESFKGFKIVHISDIHYGKTINKSKLSKVVDKIKLINPDLVVFTGDLIDKDTDITDKVIKDLINELKKINSKYGKYAVKGNHDYNSDSFIEIMENSEFNLLDNSYDLIYNSKNESIMILGLSSSIKTEIDYDKALSYFKDDNANKEIFSIALMHEPDNIDELIKYNSIDLVLSGHSHGGQIRLPFIGPLTKIKGATKYYEEYYKISNSDLYISFGLGTTTYPFRLFNKPSINFYRMYKK